MYYTILDDWGASRLDPALCNFRLPLRQVEQRQPIFFDLVGLDYFSYSACTQTTLGLYSVNESRTNTAKAEL
jgi:hypothetical protein